MRVHTYLVTFNSFSTPWTVALQVPLSMEFARQDYWSELSFPSVKKFVIPQFCLTAAKI